MAVFRSAIFSHACGQRIHVNFVFPQNDEGGGSSPEIKRTVLLLHGLNGNDESWLRDTLIEGWAERYQAAFVLPDCYRSWYSDMHYGPRFFSYITEELPSMLHRWFRLPTDREHFWVGGFSMGAYGALKCVLTRPDLFGGCVSLAPPPAGAIGNTQFTGEYTAVFGRPFGSPYGSTVEKKDNAYLLASDRSGTQPAPAMWIAVGEDDFLFPYVTDYWNHLKTLDLNWNHASYPGHAHTWAFVNEAFPHGMDWLETQFPEKEAH